ncbi:ABC transporter ATP-binding protein [Piscinibacter sakaiensis]|uniref:ABC transporter ATP-binding protein n=1 Tax=Piscinibacter sakaiensis TaxID=1547922 RepID=UPI003728E385
MSAPVPAVLKLSHLRVELAGSTPTVVALDDVCLEIAPGEILGVVGESGAGKSLTGLAVTGLLDPPCRITGGRIELNGQPLSGLPERRLQAIRGRDVGTVFQDPLTALDPLFRIGEQLVETIRVHTPLGRAAARERAVDLLAQVELPSPAALMDAYPHQLSGGMRQRVVIALALCADPRLLIADEPTTALDVSIQAQIMALLTKLCHERRLGVMLITHDLGVVGEIADRVAVMYAGRVVETGPVAQVLTAPMHPYTRGLMGAVPQLTGSPQRLAQIRGAMPSLKALPPGCAFEARCWAYEGAQAPYDGSRP